MITVTFQCGHEGNFTGNESVARCPTCANATISAVVAPPPVFTGHARGPCAVFKDLEAQAVSFGPSAVTKGNDDASS